MKAERVSNLTKEQIADFCKKNQIRKFAFYGSVLRDDFRPDSDVDVLVELEPNHTIGLFEIAQMEIDLSELMGGRKVDLRTPQDLSKYFRDKVVAEAEIQYDGNRERQRELMKRGFPMGQRQKIKREDLHER